METSNRILYAEKKLKIYIDGSIPHFENEEDTAS